MLYEADISKNVRRFWFDGSFTLTPAEQEIANEGTLRLWFAHNRDLTPNEQVVISGKVRVLRSRHIVFDTMYGMQSGEMAKKGWYSPAQTAFRLIDQLLQQVDLTSEQNQQLISGYFVRTRDIDLFVDLSRQYPGQRVEKQDEVGELLTVASFTRAMWALQLQASELAKTLLRAVDHVEYAIQLGAQVQAICEDMNGRITDALDLHLTVYREQYEQALQQQKAAEARSGRLTELIQQLERSKNDL